MTQELKTNLTQDLLNQLAELISFIYDDEGVLHIEHVRGDVRGDVCGSVRGDVMGYVGRSVWGSVKGNVWGHVEGIVLGMVQWGRHRNIGKG